MKRFIAILLTGILTFMMCLSTSAEMIEMYSNDFSTDAKGFGEAQFQVVDGWFQNKMEKPASSWDASILDPTNQRYGNFELTFDVKTVDVSRANSNLNLYFRAGANPNETYRMVLNFKNNKVNYVLDDVKIVSTERPYTFEQAKVYKIKLVAIENKFETYINDVLVLDYTDEDSNYTNGAFQFGIWEAKVAVDNFIVKAEPPPPEPILVTEVAIDKKRAELATGKTLQLKSTVYPADAEDPTVSWESADPTIATVDENGLVKALKEGTVDIKVITNDGGYEKVCKLTVVAGAVGTTSESNNGGLSPVIWIVVVAAVLVVVGGAVGVYFLIAKKKKNVAEDGSTAVEVSSDSVENIEEK